MKNNLFSVFTILLICSSCVSIYNKEFLISRNEIGITNNEIRLDGYYYRISKIKEFNHYSLDKNLKYKLDSSKFKEIIKISPIILYSDGSLKQMPYFTGLQKNNTLDFNELCYLNDDNTLKGALNHFECYLRNMPKEKYNFMNKNSEIWGQGIFTSNNKHIKLQIYYNRLGDFYLLEETGKVINDSTFIVEKRKSMRTKKEWIVSEKYHYRKMTQVPKFNSLILGDNVNY